MLPPFRDLYQVNHMGFFMEEIFLVDVSGIAPELVFDLAM